jgi:4-aminobutyrate aminotransferase-like enzyme
MERLLRSGRIGAVLLEPIQVRGGIVIPLPGFLRELRQLCDRFGAVLILDEIYTGFGRTGRWFACEHEQVIPDVVCLGKALTGGFPLSACVGRAEVMDRAWPPSTGEAIHTSTFLGHPVGCAMALAQIEEIRRLRLVEKSASVGQFLLDRLRVLFDELATLTTKFRYEVRGLGLLAGVEVWHADGKPATQLALECITRMLQRGFLLLPEGEHSNVIAFTPPLIVTERQLEAAIKALRACLLDTGAV